MLRRVPREIRWDRWRRPTADELDAAGLDEAGDWWLCSPCVEAGRLYFIKEDAMLWHEDDDEAEFADSEPDA